jgi:hypothetical protein
LLLRGFACNLFVNFFPLVWSQETAVAGGVKVAVCLFIVVPEEARFRAAERAFEVALGLVLIGEVTGKADAVVALLTG